MNFAATTSHAVTDNLRTALAVTVVAVLYYLAARLGLQLAFEQTNASPVWPPSGIAFAALLLFGRRLWPGILIGAFVANYVVFDATGVLTGTNLVLTSGTIAAGNTLEALTGVWLIHRFAGGGHFLSTVRGTTMLVISSGLMSLVSSVIGATALVVSGAIPATLARTVWFTWWLGDTAGVLTITPLMIVWAGAGALRHGGRWWFHLLAATLLTALTAAAIFWAWLWPGVASLPYLLVPLLLWASYRCGQQGGSLAVFLVATFAVLGTINGIGPFSGDSTHVSLLLLQVFVCVIAITVLVLAAAVGERDASQQALSEANRELEQRIAERTRELAASNRELLGYQEHLEDLVAQRTRELAQSNRELEAFSYSVSHDLRSPLRSIDGYSHALLEDYAGVLDEAGRNHIERVRQNAQRMGDLIDDLLQLARVSRIRLERQPVDLAALAEQALQELRSTDSERKVELDCETGLEARVDPRLFSLVIDNLLANAWKYSAPREVTRISVGRSRENGENAFHVSDNGVGFEMQYVDKLFRPFQRLHGGEFQGTGIGLATVARIVERHGGRVWASSEPERGTTIFFTVGEE